NFTTWIRAVLLIAQLFASIWDEIKCGFAVENAGFAALGLDHVQDLLDDLDLVQATLGPDGRVIGIPALRVVAFEIAALGQAHVQIVVIEQADHGGSAHTAADGGGADHTHDVVRVDRPQVHALAGQDATAGELEHRFQRPGARGAATSSS